jgi:hypothetical protein
VPRCNARRQLSLALLLPLCSSLPLRCSGRRQLSLALLLPLLMLCGSLPQRCSGRRQLSLALLLTLLMLCGLLLLRCSDHRQLSLVLQLPLLTLCGLLLPLRCSGRRQLSLPLLLPPLTLCGSRCCSLLRIMALLVGLLHSLPPLRGRGTLRHALSIATLAPARFPLATQEVPQSCLVAWPAFADVARELCLLMVWQPARQWVAHARLLAWVSPLLRLGDSLRQLGRVPSLGSVDEGASVAGFQLGCREGCGQA